MAIICVYLCILSEYQIISKQWQEMRETLYNLHETSFAPSEVVKVKHGQHAFHCMHEYTCTYSFFSPQLLFLEKNKESVPTVEAHFSK